MKLTKNIKDQILKSLLVKPELKDQIIKQWSKLTEGQRRAIIQLVETTEEVQNELLQKACRNNQNFGISIKCFTKRQEKRRRVKKESVSQEKEIEHLSSILDELDDAYINKK